MVWKRHAKFLNGISDEAWALIPVWRVFQCIRIEWSPSARSPEIRLCAEFCRRKGNLLTYHCYMNYRSFANVTAGRDIYTIHGYICSRVILHTKRPKLYSEEFICVKSLTFGFMCMNIICEIPMYVLYVWFNECMIYELGCVEK